MSTPPTAATLQAMQRAADLLQAGNFTLARATLEQVVAQVPQFAEAHRLLGLAQLGAGAPEAAERALRRAVQLQPGWAPAQTSLAEWLLAQGGLDEAEIALRAALRAGQHHQRAALLLARMLNDSARAADVLAVTTPLVDAQPADFELLTQHAAALSALQRHDEALAIYRRIAAALPGNAAAETNLAAALDAAGRHREASATAARAIDRGAATPQAHFIHARSLVAENRFDDAEAALRRALALQPAFAEAQRNLAQLIWMRSGDVARAGEFLDATLRTHGDLDALHVIKAGLLDGAGDPRGAYAAVAPRVQRTDASVELLLTAAQAALKFDAPLARALAARAMAAAPGHVLAQRLFADTLLATGDAAGAAAQATRLLAATPDDQHLIAVQTTAWRLLGDARYHAYCDYARMARAWRIDTPAGWPTLSAYLSDLARALEALHALHTHPLHQSLRHGSQTSQNLMYAEDPVIRAFFGAIDAPLRQHIDAIGRHGDDPLHRRNAGGYRLQGAWSVRLRSQGFHTNHVHPEGWLASACYIALPRSIVAPTDAADRAGWLSFGEPGVPTQPALGAEHAIRPEPGLLALFPAYFWHGTVPFTGDDHRLTIAFDIAPAAAR